jgi:hypothetical protein
LVLLSASPLLAQLPVPLPLVAVFLSKKINSLVSSQIKIRSHDHGSSVCSLRSRPTVSTVGEGEEPGSKSLPFLSFLEEMRKTHQAKKKPEESEEGRMIHESQNPPKSTLVEQSALLQRLAREEGEWEAAGEPESIREHGSGFIYEGVRVEDMDSMPKAEEVFFFALCLSRKRGGIRAASCGKIESRRWYQFELVPIRTVTFELVPVLSKADAGTSSASRN